MKSRKHQKGKEVKLSERQTKILKLICKELSPKEISDHLNISDKTFFNHRARIIAKTGAKGNIGLYKYAVSEGHVKN